MIFCVILMADGRVMDMQGDEKIESAITSAATVPDRG